MGHDRHRRPAAVFTAKGGPRWPVTERFVRSFCRPVRCCVKMDRRCLPLDAWARSILFLGHANAMRVRLVSRGLSDAFDRACWIGPAADATIPRPASHSHLTFGTSDMAQNLVRSLRMAGNAPLWLRYVRRDCVLFIIAAAGHVAALDRLARPPFSLGQADARSGDSAVLCWAALDGHAAVLDRLALPPYSLGQADARSTDNKALRGAAGNGHVAVLDRLALPPYSLGRPDAQSGDNEALRSAAMNGHVAVLDRLALPPYSLGQADARSDNNEALRRASQHGHVAVLDRLAPARSQFIAFSRKKCLSSRAKSGKFGATVASASGPLLCCLAFG